MACRMASSSVSSVMGSLPLNFLSRAMCSGAGGPRWKTCWTGLLDWASFAALACGTAVMSAMTRVDCENSGAGGVEATVRVGRFAFCALLEPRSARCAEKYEWLLFACV